MTTTSCRSAQPVSADTANKILQVIRRLEHDRDPSFDVMIGFYACLDPAINATNFFERTPRRNMVNPTFSASASLECLERYAPGWSIYEVRQLYANESYACTLRHAEKGMYRTANGPALAAALCAAILRTKLDDVTLGQAAAANLEVVR